MKKNNLVYIILGNQGNPIHEELVATTSRIDIGGKPLKARK